MPRVDYFDDSAAPPYNSLIPSVTAVVINDGALLMIHKRDNDLWAIPGGAVDIGESAAHAAARETREETGIEIAIDGLVGIYTDPRHVMAYDDGEVRQQFGETHERGVVPAGRLPLVGEGVAEHVRVDLNAGIAAAAGEQLADARRRHGTAVAEPQRGLSAVTVATTQTEVPVERLARLGPEQARARPSALSEHHGDLVVHVEVVERQVGHLRQPHSRVEEQPDDRCVAPLGEPRALARGQQRLELITRQHRHRLLGNLRRLHPRHRSAGNSSSAVSHLVN